MTVAKPAYKRILLKLCNNIGRRHRAARHCDGFVNQPGGRNLSAFKAIEPLNHQRKG